MRTMEYAAGVSERFDKWINALLAGIGVGQITLALLNAADGTELWICLLQALPAMFCLWVCGWRMHRRYYDQISDQVRNELEGRVPAKILFEQNADESVTAFVTMMSGEPVVVKIPAEVASRGRQAVQLWLLDELIARGEE